MSVLLQPRLTRQGFAEMGFQVLRHDAPPSPELPPVEAEFVLADPRRGVALLELAPARSPDAVARLRRRLEAVRFSQHFPGELPIIQHSLSAGDVWRLTGLLDGGFAAVPAITVQGQDWIAALQQALLVNPESAAAAVALPEAAPARKAGPIQAMIELRDPLPDPVAVDANSAPSIAMPDRDAAPRRPQARQREGMLHGLLLFWAMLVMIGVAGAALLHYLGPATPDRVAGPESRVRQTLPSIASGGAPLAAAPRPASPNAGPPNPRPLVSAPPVTPDAAAAAQFAPAAPSVPGPAIAEQAPPPPPPPAPRQPAPIAALPPPEPSLPAEPSSPTAGAGAVPMRIFVHHQPANRMQGEALAQRSAAMGGMVEVRAVPVPATPANREVRYFNRSDQPLAERLAARLGAGWRAQDFTHFQPTPSRGTMEVWVPGWGPEDDGSQ